MVCRAFGEDACGLLVMEGIGKREEERERERERVRACECECVVAVCSHTVPFVCTEFQGVKRKQFQDGPAEQIHFRGGIHEEDKILMLRI